MHFDSCSFTIGDKTLLEIEKQANCVQTPLSTKNQPDRESDEIIIGESPDAKENFSSYFHMSARDRLKNITQRGGHRRMLEKSKSNVEASNRYEISSISKYLCADDIDFSTWEKSAAKLISPAVATKLFPPPEPVKQLSPIKVSFTDYDNLQFDCSESQNIASQDTFKEHELDQAISAENISIANFQANHTVNDLELSVQDIDNVTFVQPHSENNLETREEAEKLIKEELVQQKSILRVSETFNNNSIVSMPHNLTIEERRLDHSLTIDSSKNLRFLSNWNLPPSVVNEYRKKNVTEMFDWQCECLKNPKVLFDGANLVYSAPTSAGKTLVSEILMIKNIIERKKKALFILPFVAVVREKMFYLQVIFNCKFFETFI